jgi:biopolymer transport protein ExbB
VEAHTAVGFGHFLAQTDAVSKTILALLLIMSIVTWYLIVTKALSAWLTRRRSDRFVRTFWNSPSLPAVASHLEEHSPDEPFSHLT